MDDNGARHVNGPRRLGDLLVENGHLTPAKLRRALRHQRENGVRLGEALLRLGYITGDQLAAALAEQKRLPLISLHEVFPNPRALSLLTEKFIRSRRVMPVDFDQDALILAMVDPLDVLTLDDVRVITSYDVLPVVTTQASLDETLDTIYTQRGGLAEAELLDFAPPVYAISEDREEAEDTSVITLVNEILDGALKRRASDIHLEPGPNGMLVRVRIDGVLHRMTDIPASITGGVISRVKIMADMDIAEKRLPQDGRAGYRTADQTVDLRIASLPSVYGENVTIRLLDETMFDISLEELGMGPEALEGLRRTLVRPHGLVLITGPTGSGKSTTLYAGLEEINREGTKIYTVEDPVERKIPGVIQSQVKPGIGLSFSRMLRSLLRSDPDIIMIGEIRDAETATICCEASLTGHLVLSTLHTNDAASTVTRLMEMGVPPYLVSSSLECVVAQRLARRLCPACMQTESLRAEQMTPTEREVLGEEPVEVARAVGCQRCYGTGYVGRLALFEVLPVTKELRSLILAEVSTEDIREYARGLGVRSLRDAGLAHVLAHLTTAEEIHRVTI